MHKEPKLENHIIRRVMHIMTRQYKSVGHEEELRAWKTVQQPLRKALKQVLSEELNLNGR